MKIEFTVIVKEFYPPDVGDGVDVFKRTVSAQALPRIGDHVPIGDMQAVVTSVEHPLCKGVLVHEMVAQMSVRETRGAYFDLWREMNRWESEVLHPLMEREGFRFVSTSGLDGD